MQDAQNVADVTRLRSVDSLRVCTFCAEPTSPTRAAVRHGAAHAVVHQFVLGHRAWRHCLDAFLRQCRLPAARRCAHLSAAVGHGRRVDGCAGQRAGLRVTGRRASSRSAAHRRERRDRDRRAVSVSGAHGLGRRGELPRRGRARVARRGRATSSATKHLLVALEGQLGVHAGRLRGAVRRRRLLAARPQRRRDQRLGPSAWARRRSKARSCATSSSTRIRRSAT